MIVAALLAAHCSRAWATRPSLIGRSRRYAGMYCL